MGFTDLEGYFATEPQRALYKSTTHWSLSKAVGKSSYPAAQLLP